MPKYVAALFGLALGAALAAPLAQAEPSTDWLEGLRAAITARYDEIPEASPLNLIAERKALARSLAAFRAPSSSVVGDLRIFQRVAKPIEELDTLSASGISDALAASYTSFRDHVAAMRDELPPQIEALVDPRVHDKAMNGYDDANGAIVLADVAELPSAKAILLRKAHAAAARTSARIARATACRGGVARPGRAYVACFVDETPFVPRLGGATSGADGGAESRVTVTGYGLAARDDAMEISWDTGAFTGPGTYDLDGSSGAMIVLVADRLTFTSVSGSVVVTEFDAAARRMKGTFSGVVSTETGNQRLLSGGVFSSCYAIAKR